MPELTKDQPRKNMLVECLNEILSAENAVVERLEKRISETHSVETKNSLQHELQEERNHQVSLRNLISAFGGLPTSSKSKLLSFGTETNQTIDITDLSFENDKKLKFLQGDNLGNTGKTDIVDSMEHETLQRNEDAFIENAQILAYKMVAELAEKIDAKDARDTLRQNIQEKERTYNKIIEASPEMNYQNQDDKNHHQSEQQKKSFQIGSEIASILTSYWNSKEHPSKVYIFNRRVHHGTVGAFLGLSSLYKKQPIVTGFLSGLGEGLAKDDYDDFREWFSFKKKENDNVD
jgi:ferritin-like metal-binding protein YciE